MLIFGPAARAQVPVPSTFFGVTSSGKLNGSSYEIWWPNDVNASLPPISIGAAGKEIQAPWGVVDNDVADLTWHTDGSSAGGYWTTLPKWDNLKAYVAAAQGSGVPITYTFFQVPQYNVCYDYVGNGGPLYGPPGNPHSLVCPSNNVTAPYNTIYTNVKGTTGEVYCRFGRNDGTGWCPGPGYNNKFSALTAFAAQLVSEFTNQITHQVAFKYYEIWNEPNNEGATYWTLNTAGTALDWNTLILQTSALETAINGAYSANHITSPSSPAIFVGPGIASRGNTDSNAALCGSCGGAPFNYGFLNTTAGGVTGASLISIGSFHLYPANDFDGNDQDPKQIGDTADCMNTTPAGTSYTTIECTGANLVSAATDRLNDFHAYSTVSQVFMTEGSWMHNNNFSTQGTQILINQAMRAYIARYTLLMAATQTTYSTAPYTMNVNAQHWFEWVGSLDLGLNGEGIDDYGTACDDLLDSNAHYPCYTVQPGFPGDPYAGFAYGQVINWLAGNKITACAGSGSAPCTDTANSVWALPITVVPGTNPTELAVWTWDDLSSVVCPGGYGCPSLANYRNYQTLESSTVYPLGSSITLSQEPILLEH
jgi:hypothetical protein